MHLYVVRHGTTDNNVNNLVNGRNNNDINEQGIKEANCARLILDKINFESYYCSPLLRAKHTMDIINSKEMFVNYDERLSERDAGIMTNKPSEEIDARLWNSIDVDVIYGGSENFKDVINRVQSFLDELKEKHGDDTILIVTHLEVMKAIEICINGYPGLEEVMSWNYPNCIIKRYYL